MWIWLLQSCPPGRPLSWLPGPPASLLCWGPWCPAPGLLSVLCPLVWVVHSLQEPPLVFLENNLCPVGSRLPFGTQRRPLLPSVCTWPVFSLEAPGGRGGVQGLVAQCSPVSARSCSCAEDSRRRLLTSLRGRGPGREAVRPTQAPRLRRGPRQRSAWGPCSLLGRPVWSHCRRRKGTWEVGGRTQRRGERGGPRGQASPGARGRATREDTDNVQLGRLGGARNCVFISVQTILTTTTGAIRAVKDGPAAEWRFGIVTSFRRHRPRISSPRPRAHLDRTLASRCPSPEGGRSGSSVPRLRPPWTLDEGRRSWHPLWGRCHVQLGSPGSWLPTRGGQGPRSQPALLCGRRQRPDGRK